MQTARGCHWQPRNLAHHRRQPGLTQAFFEAQQHARIIIRFGIDNAVRVQANAGEGRGEQIGPAQAPQHHPIEPRQNACDEQRRGGGLRRIGDLMHRAQSKPPLRQMPVERGDPKRQHRARRAAGMFDAGDPGAQCVENAWVSR